MHPALIVILVILGILAIVGIVFANGVSVLWASFILFGLFLFVITLISFFNDDVKECFGKFDLSSKLRGHLAGGSGLPVGETIQRILILIMSAASVALIVRAIIFTVKIFTEYLSPDSLSDASRDWMMDIMGDVPVMNVLMLLVKSFNTDLRPDFFVVVMMLSLVVTGIAAVVVQVIMLLVNNTISEAKEGSTLFMILGNFSVMTLTVAGTMFLSSLVGPLLDFSKPWDGFENFCRPFLSSNFGNFLLQVLVTAVMLAVLVLLCFDWVQTMVLGGAGMIVWLIFQFVFTLIVSIFTSNDYIDSSYFFLLLFLLYPIVDIIKNRVCEDKSELVWLPVAVPLVLGVILMLIETVVGGFDHTSNFLSILQIISLFIFIVYLLAMPGIEIIKSSDE